MKKIISILSVLMILAVLPYQNISAASGSVSIRCPGTASPNTSVTCTAVFSASDTAFFQIDSVSATGASIQSGPTSGILNDGEQSSVSVSYTVKVGGSGTSTLSISGTYAITGSSSPGSEASFSNSTSITVVAPPNPDTGGNSGGGNTGGGNTGGGSSSGGSSGQVETPVESGPFINSLALRQDGTETLYAELAITEKNSQHELVLPKNVLTAILDVSAPEGVSLNYDKNISFNGEEESKEIKINAVKDDESQDYILIVKKAVVAKTSFSLNDKSYTIFDDDSVDEVLSPYGLLREGYEEASGASFYYVKNNLKIQLFKDEEGKSVWLLLNDENEVLGIVNLYFHNQDFLIIKEADEAARTSLLQKQSYGAIEVALASIYSDAFKDFAFNQEFKGWQLSDGAIVYAQNSEGEMAYYHINQAGDFTKAYLAFDSADQRILIWAYTASAIAGILALAFLAYYLRSQKRIRHYLQRNEARVN